MLLPEALSELGELLMALQAVTAATHTFAYLNIRPANVRFESTPAVVSQTARDSDGRYPSNASAVVRAMFARWQSPVEVEEHHADHPLLSASSRDCPGAGPGPGQLQQFRKVRVCALRDQPMHACVHVRALASARASPAHRWQPRWR